MRRMGVLVLGCKVSRGVADLVWSWTSKDVKSRQAKEEDVVKGWDETEQDEACDPIFILGPFGGVQIREGNLWNEKES